MVADAIVPGGPSLYAARAALALGARVSLVTNLPRTYDGPALEGLDVVALPAGAAPRYTNAYDDAGHRTQRLLGEGEPLETDGLGLESAEVVIAAPAFHELQGFPCIAAPVRAVSLQGPLRSVTADGEVVPHPQAWVQAEPFAAPGAFAFLSDEDTPDANGLGQRLASRGMTAFVTHGDRGATRYDPDGHVRRFPAFPACTVDPTGAGDCFAAAFAVRFSESHQVEEATRFALAAAALSVEGRGPLALPSRAAVEARLREAA